MQLLRRIKKSTGRQTYQLISDVTKWLYKEHGGGELHLIQALIGHRYFKANLKQFMITNTAIFGCYRVEDDNAIRVLLDCVGWHRGEKRLINNIGWNYRPTTCKETMSCMKKYRAVEDYLMDIVKKQEEDTRGQQQSD